MVTLRGGLVGLILPVLATIALAIEPVPKDDLSLLAAWLVGSFSSAEQAAADTNFSDIRLHMVPIWPERSDAIWLYVEQASVENLAKPYRQRIYRLSRLDDRTLQSEVYSLPDPLRFAGDWERPERFGMLAPESLTVRDGCAIRMERSGDTAFVGGTTGKNCLSDLRGAAYATSEVVVTSDYLYSWDRGFDSAGAQVWGARHGGYFFRKTVTTPAE